MRSSKKGRGKRSKGQRRARAAEITDMDISSSTAEATTSADEVTSVESYRGKGMGYREETAGSYRK